MVQRKRTGRIIAAPINFDKADVAIHETHHVHGTVNMGAPFLGGGFGRCHEYGMNAGLSAMSTAGVVDRAQHSSGNSMGIRIRAGIPTVEGIAQIIGRLLVEARGHMLKVGGDIVIERVTRTGKELVPRGR